MFTVRSNSTGLLVRAAASVVLLAAAVLLGACSGDSISETGSAGNKPKVALIAAGLINDGTYNQASGDAVKRLEKEGRIALTIRENNTDPVAIESVLREYATRGYDLIITNGYQAIEPVKKVAQEFPKVNFTMTGGKEVLGLATDNVEAATLDGANWGYIAGFIAGKIEGVKVVGLVGGPQLPVIEEVHTGFKAGLRDTDPSRTWKEAYTGSFDDVQKAQEAANALISQGAQLIFTTGDGMGYGVGAAAVAQEPKVLTIGVGGEMARKVNITSVKSNEYPRFLSYVESVVAGTFGNRSHIATFANEGYVLTPPEDGATDPRIPADLQAQIAELIADLRSGKRTVPTS